MIDFALRGSGFAIASQFHTLVMQPTTLCNLDCAYCYLPDRRRRRLMSVAVAECCARSVAAQDSSHPVDVVWHGGEPTATPLPHFRALLAPFRELHAAGLVRHGIQTNATLIDEPWCDLFLDQQFQVGISVDGPLWANRHRLDRAGRDTHDRVLRGVCRLADAGVRFSAICVVTAETIGQVDALVDFFTHIGCASVGFNIEEQEGSRRSPVEEEGAYQFWRRLVKLRVGGNRMPVRDLDRLAGYLRRAHGDQVEPPRPVDPIPTVGVDGQVVLLSPELLGVSAPRYDDFLAGNVVRTPLPDMIRRAGQLRYVQEFGEALRSCAATCGFFDFCRGAQAGNRFFEHGHFSTAETHYCRTTRQALVRAAADELAPRREVIT